MAEFYKIINDDTNYALEPNVYLEEIKKETDQEKRYQMLKKYFAEKITRNLYQNMDLLHGMQTDFEQFKKIYLLIARDLFMNTLLGIDVLASERGTDLFDPSKIRVPQKPEDNYSISNSYIHKPANR